MGQETFTAGVQYGDFKGTVAADDADVLHVRRFLEEQNLIKAKDFVAGFKAYTGFGGEKKGQDVHLTAYIVDLTGFDDLQKAISAGPVNARTVDVYVPLAQFFALFKRLEIAASLRGSLTNREISIKD